MTNKLFTITKIGYSSGTYGCTGEYFIAIWIDKDGGHSYPFHGLYGAENRVAEALKDAGYEEFYTGAGYGRLTGEDRKRHHAEHTAIEYIKDHIIK